MEEESHKVSEYERQHEKYVNIIPTLETEIGWIAEELVKYQGVWLNLKAGLKEVMLAQKFFTPQPTDIFLASFPKSGTTWLKALMFTIVNRKLYPTNQHHPLLSLGPHDCVPFLEHLFSDETKMSKLDHFKPPRILATHTSYFMLQNILGSVTSVTTPRNKIVYVARNPKDVLVSSWEFMRKIRAEKDVQPPDLTLEEAYDKFCNGVAIYGPYWEHVLGYYRASLTSENHLLFLTYEEMTADPSFWVRRVAEFLDVGFNLEEEQQGVVEEIVTLCSFKSLSNMEVNKNGAHDFLGQFSVPHALFFREAKVGNWNKHLTAEMANRLDEITKLKFEGSGPSFLS